LRNDLYAGAHPAPEDVFLLVEVSDTSLAYDHGLKLALYAGAGIPEVWVVNLSDDLIEVYALPRSGKYQEAREAQRGETIEARSVPGLTLAVDDILG
jgi:Uma2 family endonuclease